MRPLTHPTRLFLSFFLLFVSIVSMNATALAQSDDPGVLKRNAKALVDELRMTEALPLYEKLVKLTPSDPEAHYYLGLSLLGQAANTEDPNVSKQLRIRAREAFVKARDLGDDSQLIRGFIEGMPADGSDGPGFSDNSEANASMQKGEAAFSSGKLDEALNHYKNALKMDPRCYYAALFSGDVSMQKNNFAEAEIWYKKAIAIDPNIETAYRYSATPLMKQGKYDQARDRYVEAFITDPYSRLALSGIIQWGQATQTPLGHPKVDVPEVKVGADGKATSTINVNPLADDGSLAWGSYVAAREVWRKEKFAKLYPGAAAYRHSLAEELDALRSVVSAAMALKPKSLNEQIAILAELDKDGVLEAFILMAIPDAGIARDHRPYLLAHRDKLRQYVLKYVIGKSK